MQNLNNFLNSNYNSIYLFMTFISISISVIVALFTYKNLKELKLTRLEEVRACILLYITKKQSNRGYEIVLKNFGKSQGKVLDICITPQLDYKKCTTRPKDDIKLISDFKNIILAPNQALKTIFHFHNYPDSEFNVTIKYITCGKTFEENYTLNIEPYKVSLSNEFNVENQLVGLREINRSLLEISNKLD